MSIWSDKVIIGTYNSKLPNRYQDAFQGISGHFRKKKIGVGSHGQSWGTITRGHVVLGKYVKYFSMPTLALIPQNWGLKKSGKKTFLAREKTNLPPTTFFCILKNIRHQIINFGSAVCSQIFVFCISYANLFFPCKICLDEEAVFSSFLLHLPTIDHYDQN